jgi:hypothetical protein
MEEAKVTDLTTPVEQTTEPNGNEPWSLGTVTRGAADRLNEINERVEQCRKGRHALNAEIKELLAERVKIERLMKAVERDVRPRGRKVKAADES